MKQKVALVMQASQVATAAPSLWSSIREAILGSHQDFTTGSLNRAILLLAIPMVLEMVLESLFAVAMGLSLSTTAMVARRVGEKDPEGAAVAGVQAIAIGVAVSILLGVPCFF